MGEKDWKAERISNLLADFVINEEQRNGAVTARGVRLRARTGSHPPLRKA